MGSRLLVELGSKGVLFMFLLVEVVESSLMLGSKVLQRYIFCKLVGSRVLLVQISIWSPANLDRMLTGFLQSLLSKDTSGVVLVDVHNSW